MAMAQCLEVYYGAGDRAKAGGDKKGSGRFQKRNKKGAALTMQGNDAGALHPVHPLHCPHRLMQTNVAPPCWFSSHSTSTRQV